MGPLLLGGALVSFLEDDPSDPLAGFNTMSLIIKREQIEHGGPAKGGIPALSRPETTTIPRARFMSPKDRVVGVTVAGESRAYPIRILNWHEVINDELGGIPILVAYCPLCDSVTVADRRLEGKRYEFGVSGKVYQSNLLLFDRTHNALWSQIGFMAVSGPNAGRSLQQLGNWQITTYKHWRKRFPDSTVVTLNTGYPRDYGLNPYQDYMLHEGLLFGVDPLDERLPKKARVVGIRLGDSARAYPVEQIFASPKGVLRDNIGAGAVLLRGHRRSGTVILEKIPQGAKVAYSFWFAWAAQHPHTQIYKR